MRLIIAGGRDFSDKEKLYEEVAKLENITEIVSGKAKGADSLGEQYAKDNNISVKLFPANWKKYGKAAGPIRNEEMAKYADSLIAFWDGKSLGTKSMISLARGNSLSITIINYIEMNQIEKEALVLFKDHTLLTLKVFKAEYLEKTKGKVGGAVEPYELDVLNMAIDYHRDYNKIKLSTK